MKSLREKTFWFKGFALDLKRGCISGEQGEIDLRPKSFEVLRYLVENAGRLVPKDEIIKAVWPDVVVTDESLARCISDVRLALRDHDQRIVKTVPRRGYMLDAPVSDSAPRSATSAAAGAVHEAESVGPQPQPAERRLLTILACEFVGLGAVSARLDPEDLRIAITVWHQRCAEIVERFQGHVARYLDDGLLAYFGYPRAAGHDTEHALRAALALLAAAPALKSPSIEPPQLRIGVASGVVIVGDESLARATRERIATGETPHLARNLQLSAEPGTVLIDETTQRLTGGLFDCEDLGSIGREGRSVRAWRVLKPSEIDSRFEASRVLTVAPSYVAPSGTPPERGNLTPFVGRARELDLLAACLAARADRVLVLDIAGEAGMGKSRLLFEFRSRLNDARPQVWQGSCWPDDQQLPYRPFIRLLRRRFRLTAGESQDDVERKLEAGLTLLDMATPLNVALLLNLLGMRPREDVLRGLDDVLIGLRTRELLSQFVRQACRLGPLIIVLEDLHWIDSASQDLLARLIESPIAGSLAIVHTRRPEFEPAWIESSNVTTIRLEPLSPDETSQIVQSRLGGPDLTGKLARLIVDRAEGNPLFAEEIANFLIQSGIVQPRASTLEYDASAVAAALPASVQSLLSARMDRLSAGDRDLLQAAAVIGRRFTSELLTVLTPVDVAERLAAMESADLVRRDRNSDEHVFKHVLVRDALYAGLTSVRREALHLAIAREIERRNADRLTQVAEALAHHYSRGNQKEKAVEYLALVGKKSLGIYSLDQAEHALRAALLFARSRDSRRLDVKVASIMVDLAVVLYLQFRSRDTIALIEPELDSIDTLGDIREVPILLDLYSIALFTHCRFREGRRLEAKAFVIAERVGDKRAKAHASAGLIMLSIYVDPMPLADFEAFATRAIREAEEGDDTYIAGRIIMATTMNYINRGLLLEARGWALRLTSLSRERQDQRSLGMALWLLGWLDIMCEDYVSALAHGEECLETAIAPFDRHIGHHVVGLSQMLLGRFAEGYERLERYHAEAVAHGWIFAALVTEAPLGAALLLNGRFKEGVRLLESVIHRCEAEYGYQSYADWTRSFLAEFYITLLEGTRKPPLRVVLRNLIFLANSRRVAAKTAQALLQQASRNPQMSERGGFRARLDYDFGVLYKAQGRPDLAQKHLCNARTLAAAQQMPALVSKIDAAMSSL